MTTKIQTELLATGAAAANVGTHGVTTDMIAGGPAFSAYQSAAQTLTSATWTKLTCQTEEFDTNSNYDNATNYRFTPTVAGYYLVTLGVTFTVVATLAGVCIYKNGAAFKYPQVNALPAGSIIAGSALIYLNGTTDYVEAFVYNNGVAPQTQAASTLTYFQASLARPA